MEPITIALLGLAILTALLVLRIPVAVAMLTVGMGGYVMLSGIVPLFDYMKTGAYWRFASYNFSVIPLFFADGPAGREIGPQP